MKKIYMCVIFLFIFNINIIGVNAYYETQNELDWIDGSCIHNKSCLKLCSYYTETDPVKQNEKNYFQGIYVYYHFDGTYQISYDKQKTNVDPDKNYGKTTTKKGTKDSIFQTPDSGAFTGVLINDETYNDLVNNGVCPKYAYVSTTYGSDSVCFDNGEYCKSGLQKGYIIYGRNSYSITTLDSTLKPYFDNFPTDQCPSYKDCKIYNISDRFTIDFYINYMHENKIPLFMQNNMTYKAGIEKILSLYDSHREKVKKEIDGDSTLSQKEKDNIYKTIDEDITTRKSTFQKMLIHISEENTVAVPGDEENIENVCETVPEVLRKYITDALKLIRWIGLVAMIILGVLDFTKAVASDDQDALKKAWGHFTKRLIAVIILFILPLLVDLILDLVGIQTCSM